MDAIAEARQQESNDRLPFIAAESFWKTYKTQDDGSVKEIEWVRWVKKGTTNPSTCEERISLISKKPNPIWEVLEPYYKHWKEGEATPTNGVPLAAWPGATPELVKLLNSVNIRSVEDFCEMEDSAIQRLNLPGMRGKQQIARAFNEARKSTGPVAAELSKLREENELLRKDIEELKSFLNQAPDEAPAQPAEAKRKPGRPKKVVTE